MKRKVPVVSLDHFFNIKKEKKPQALDTVISTPRTQLSIVKSQTSKNIPHISIPSLNEDPEDIEKICEKKLQEIKSTINFIFTENSKVNFSRISDDVEYLCRNKSSEALYNAIIPDLDTIAKNFISSIPEEFDLFQISSIIEEFERNLSYFQKIFIYLDRMYIFTHRIDGYLSIKDVFHSLIRKYLSNEVCETISFSILKNIQEFRCTDLSSDTAQKIKQSLKICLSFAQQSKFYINPFESQLLIQTKEFFETVSSSIDLFKLIVFANENAEKEKQLYECGLLKNTYDSIKAMFNNIVLKSNKEKIFNSNMFYDLIDKQELQPIQDIYNLYSQTEELQKIMINYYTIYWTNKVAELLDDKSKKNEWIPDMLKIATESQVLTSKIFNLSKEASRSVKEQVRHTIQSKDKKDKLESLLAQYLDKGNEFSAKVITFFRLLEASECFEASYSYLLKKRILKWNVSVSRERNIIEILTKENGREYTQHLNELINDYSKSSTMKQPKLPQSSIEYRSLWLHSTNWINEKDEAVFPEEIQTLNKMFIDSVDTNNKAVNVYCSATLATCCLKCQGKLILMTGDQAILLLKLQEIMPNSMSIDNLSNELKLEESTIEDDLNLFEKFGFVIKNHDNYSVNPNFLVSDLQNMLNIDPNSDSEIELPPAHTSTNEMKKIMEEENVSQKRENILKCHVVSILKEFKQLKLADLLQKVKKEITFTPDPQKFIGVLNYLTKADYIQQRSSDTYCYTV